MFWTIWDCLGLFEPVWGDCLGLFGTVRGCLGQFRSCSGLFGTVLVFVCDSEGSVVCEN